MSSATPSRKFTSFSHILKNTGIFSVVQGMVILLNIVRNKLAAMFIGPGGIGILSIYNNTSNLLNQSTNFGIPTTGVKELSAIEAEGDRQRIETYASTIRLSCVMTGLFGMLIGLVIIMYDLLFSSTSILLSIGSKWHYLLLLPVVGIMSVTGGEMAILKGMKQFGRVAIVSLLVAAVSLLVFAPFLYLLGSEGIIWALLISTLCICFVHLFFSVRIIPYRIHIFSYSHIKRMYPLLRVGIWLIVAGLFGQLSELVIKGVILYWGGTEEGVGLYQSGYMMVATYGSLILAVLEFDYFPRLSSTRDDSAAQNVTVNRQIEVSVLLMAPFLLLFVTLMPKLIPLFFTDAFTPSIPMAIGALLFLYFRAFGLSIGYIPLARGENWMFMLTEIAYDVTVAILVPFAYIRWGLVGAGVMLSAVSFLELIFVSWLYRWRYKFRFDFRLMWLYLLQFVLLSGAIVIHFLLSGPSRWAICALLFGISFYFSFRIITRETDILQKLKQKFHTSHE